MYFFWLHLAIDYIIVRVSNDTMAIPLDSFGSRFFYCTCLCCKTLYIKEYIVDIINITRTLHDYAEAFIQIDNSTTNQQNRIECYYRLVYNVSIKIRGLYKIIIRWCLLWKSRFLKNMVFLNVRLCDTVFVSNGGRDRQTNSERTPNLEMRFVNWEYEILR